MPTAMERQRWGRCLSVTRRDAGGRHPELGQRTVTNLGGTSMTVTNTSCDLKVTFGPTVTISKQALGSTSDLQDSETVTITGTRQADGSILAQTIQIGPAGGGGVRPGAGGGATGTGGGG